MRRHVSTAASSKATYTTGRIIRHIGGRIGTLGSHSIFEGTLGCEVIAGANTALDLCILELELLLVLVALVFCRRLPVGLWAEENVLSDGDSVGLWACGLALLLTEFCPCLALGYAGVYDLFDNGLLDASCSLDFLAVLIYTVGYDRLGSILVLGDLLLGEGEVVVIFLFSPVGAAILCQKGSQKGNSAALTRLLETYLLYDMCGMG